MGTKQPSSTAKGPSQAGQEQLQRRDREPLGLASIVDMTSAVPLMKKKGRRENLANPRGLLRDRRFRNANTINQSFTFWHHR
jgi:hypothetical protein